MWAAFALFFPAHRAMNLAHVFGVHARVSVSSHTEHPERWTPNSWFMGSLHGQLVAHWCHEPADPHISHPD